MAAASHYEILGVPADCTAGDVERAYRRRALETHPDRNRGGCAEEEFVAVKAACDALLEAKAKLLPAAPKQPADQPPPAAFKRDTDLYAHASTSSARMHSLQ
ncbi:Chaperone protein DnaJ [Diplonema papillatum]|nr:Chaperone protein DnaJ [Diplonema papillatum]